MTETNPSHFVVVPGVAGFDVRVDDNGDVEFNMTLIEFVNNESGERGELLQRHSESTSPGK